METTTSNRINVLKADIAKLRQSAQKRQQWLQTPINRMKSTFPIVLKDFKDIMDEIDMLEEELKILIRNNHENNQTTH